MKRFGLFRRTVGLCLDQAARLWAEGVRSPEEFLCLAAHQDGRAALRRLLGVDGERLETLVAAARGFVGRGTRGARPTVARNSSGAAPSLNGREPRMPEWSGGTPGRGARQKAKILSGP